MRRGTSIFETRWLGWLGVFLLFGMIACDDGGVKGGEASDDADRQGENRDSDGLPDPDTTVGPKPDTDPGTGKMDTQVVRVDTGTAGREDSGSTRRDTGKRDSGSQQSKVVRFIAMGDTGEGNQEQKRVAKGAQKRCDKAGGCHGFIMLGDNIYDAGADSAMDKQFTTKIDKPYRVLKKGPPPPQGQPDNRKRMPIYVSLGNHDLGEIPLNRQKITYNVKFYNNNPWYYFPSEIWDKKIGSVHLMSMHTNPLAYKGSRLKKHSQMVSRVLQNSSANWTIAFGHHPYRSNGQHGNAGEYEAIPGDLTINGGDYREWVNKNICGKVDFLLTGHDHNRQWLKKQPKLDGSFLGSGGSSGICDTHMAVSGAGAKTREVKDRGNKTAFAQPTLGFLFLEFHPKKANVEFCGPDGKTEWSKTIQK